jgi:TonB-dependent SusC/RagA subfamily outer membrane receptor
VKKQKKILIAFIVLLISFSGFKLIPQQSDFWLKFISERFNLYTQKIPQQKVYLHINRKEFYTNQRFWYKAYLFNSKDQKPDTISTNLYVELISPEKKVFMQQLLKLKNGLAYGDFPMHDTIKTGIYQIRAYTRNMKNYGIDYLFTKEFSIIHPEKLYYNKEMHRKAKSLTKQALKIDLQFFPEGGNLVVNLKNRLAFKAIDNSGKGINISGAIYTKNGEKVSSFTGTHRGMGFLSFLPQQEKKYYALINYQGKKYGKYKLPEILKKGYTLHVEQKNGKDLSVKISSNKRFDKDPVAKTVYLFAQSGGKLCFNKAFQFSKNEIQVKIPDALFPTGITQITLFDGYGKAQCERLVFINHHDFMNIKTKLNKEKFVRRQKVELNIHAEDKNGNPLKANLSVSVNLKEQLLKENPDKTNIISSLLLSSDVRGNIERPLYYFSGAPDAEKNLDLLLMTQAWRKFRWEEILADTLPEPDFPLEHLISISGRLTKYVFDISAKYATIKLTFLNRYNDVYKTQADKKGRFSFDNLDYNDTLDVLLEFRSRYGKKNIMVLLQEDKDIGINFNPYTSFYTDSLLVKHKIEYKALPKEEDDPNVPKDFKLHTKADQVIYFDKAYYSGYTSVMDALRGKVPGLSIGQNGSMIRGPNSFMLSNEPLYIIDGVFTSFDAVQSLNVNDVERVEILKGTSAAIYGSRASNGVIAVYTKRGYFYKRGEYHFKMLGYHTPRIFYSPKYNPLQNYNKPDKRIAVYWNPNVQTDASGNAKIQFYTSDIGGVFEIIIEGMSENGKIGTKTIQYSVSE